MLRHVTIAAWQLMAPTLGGNIDQGFLGRYDATVQAHLRLDGCDNALARRTKPGTHLPAHLLQEARAKCIGEVAEMRSFLRA